MDKIKILDVVLIMRLIGYFVFRHLEVHNLGSNVRGMKYLKEQRELRGRNKGNKGNKGDEDNEIDD